MRRYTGTLTDNTGALQPGQLLNIYFTGTTTPVALFDATGSPVSNPLTTDGNGQYAFFVHSGTYDFRDVNGNLVLLAEQIFDHTNPSEWLTILTNANRVARRFISISTASSVVIDTSIADIYQLLMGATIVALSISNPTVGQDLTLMFTQPNAGGPYDVNAGAWPAGVIFSGGQKPNLSQPANAIDVFDFTYTGTLWVQRGESRNES